MKWFLIAALSATAICGFAAATPAFAQATVTGVPRGTAPVTIEGYGPSSLIVCNQAGYCWHSMERYDYPPTAGLVVHPFGWTWDSGRTTPGGSTRAAAIGRAMSGRRSEPWQNEKPLKRPRWPLFRRSAGRAMRRSITDSVLKTLWSLGRAPASAALAAVDVEDLAGDEDQAVPLVARRTSGARPRKRN